MTPGARIQAAIEILTALDETRTPADEVLKAWGRAHRFAGSKDRAAIRQFVMTSYRHRGEAADMMGTQNPRAILLGTLKLGLDWSLSDIEGALGQNKYDAAALSEDERERLSGDGPGAGAVNWPNWLAEKIHAGYGPAAEELMAALTQVPPLDLRVNMAAADRDEMVEALAAVGFEVEKTPYSPIGLRVQRTADLGGVNIRALPLFKDGRIEIQDEGSQIVALMAGAEPGQTVVDLCSGGSGKTLVLGGLMNGEGRLIACDVDEGRIRAGYERETRAGLDFVEHCLIADWTPEDGDRDPGLEDLRETADLVFLDVPCSGSGAWRRQPEAKWRLSPKRLTELTLTQAGILQRGARLVRPGGRLVYVTCSVLPEENAGQIEAFLGRGGFRLLDAGAAFEQVTGRALESGPFGLQLAPHITQTDGFFIALLEKDT